MWLTFLLQTGECLEEYHRKSITAMPEYFRLGFNNMSDNGIVFVISENDPSLVAFKLKVSPIYGRISINSNTMVSSLAPLSPRIKVTEVASHRCNSLRTTCFRALKTRA
jgi:hypothetical protein